MEEIIVVFENAYAYRALVASVFVGVTCGVLGCFIVLRNMAMIGDALSHAVLPGIVVGFLVAGYSLFAFFGGAVAAGVLTAVLITLIQRNVRTKPEAAIGIVFTSMFALGVMGISYITRTNQVHLDLKDFLFGNVLGISNYDLVLTGGIMVFVVLCTVFFFRYLFLTTFDPVVAKTMGISSSAVHYFLMLLLSFSVVASLQSVGVILVVAMLVIPASTAYLLTDNLRWMLFWAAFLGVVATIAGLLIAVLINTTPGPAMTLVAAVLYVLAVFFSPRRGLVLNRFRRKLKPTSNPTHEGS